MALLVMALPAPALPEVLAGSGEPVQERLLMYRLINGMPG